MKPNLLPCHETGGRHKWTLNGVCDNCGEIRHKWNRLYAVAQKAKDRARWKAIDILPGLKARGFLEYKYARHLQS